MQRTKLYNARMFRFDLLPQARRQSARLGRLHTAHGVVETPAFMPVGTQATVKGLTPQQLEAAGEVRVACWATLIISRCGPAMS